MPDFAPAWEATSVLKRKHWPARPRSGRYAIRVDSDFSTNFFPVVIKRARLCKIEYTIINNNYVSYTSNLAFLPNRVISGLRSDVFQRIFTPHYLRRNLQRAAPILYNFDRTFDN